MITRHWGLWVQTIALLILVLLMTPFALHAIGFGQGGLRNSLPAPHYLMTDNSTANIGIFGHMLFGAVITILIPFQLIGPLRRRWTGLHRWSGRLIACAAVFTAIGGLLFIVIRGTIGGLPMDVGFGLYGCLTLLAAVQTARFGWGHDVTRHRAWALRFFWLAIGSWLYRFHYVLWYIATGGAWSNSDFTGAFDLVQNIGFYLPYLIGVEIYLRRRNKGKPRFSSP